MDLMTQHPTFLQTHNLSSALKALVEDRLIPALAAAIFDHKSILDMAAVGQTKKWVDFPVTVEHRFQIGANIKSITATLAALLVQRGQISWDAALADVIPVAGAVMHQGYRQVTLRHLLQHMAGVPPYTAPKDFKRLDFDGESRQARIDFLAHVLQQPPRLGPGTQPLYANADYIIAAAMLEAAAGEDWAALLQRNLLAPLDISLAFGAPARKDPSQPWGHRQRMLWLRPVPPAESDFPAFTAPALDGCLSLPDYAAFAQLHLKGLVGANPTLLPAETIQLLHAPIDGVAMGWGVQTLFQQAAHVHTGNVGGFFAVIALVPAADLGFIVFANAGDRLTEKAAIGFLKILVSDYISRGVPDAG